MAATPSPETDPSGRDGPIALAIAALVLATVVIGSLVPSSVPPKPVQAQTLLPDSDPACAEWSDGCRVCRRLEEGPTCSTPGIACTPGPQQCLHRTTDR